MYCAGYTDSQLYMILMYIRKSDQYINQLLSFCAKTVNPCFTRVYFIYICIIHKNIVKWPSQECVDVYLCDNTQQFSHLTLFVNLWNKILNFKSNTFNTTF